MTQHWEAEAGGSQVEDHPWLHSESDSSLEYMRLSQFLIMHFFIRVSVNLVIVITLFFKISKTFSVSF